MGAAHIGDSHATRPDILIRRGREVLAVVDTKWKQLTKGVSQQDVYQMMAYARLYSCQHLILLYPAVPGGDPTRPEPRGLVHGTERLDIATLGLGDDAHAIREALSRLICGVIGDRAISEEA